MVVVFHDSKRFIRNEEVVFSFILLNSFNIFYPLAKTMLGRFKGRQFKAEDYEIVNITNKSSQVHDRCFDVFMELKARCGLVKWKPIEMASQKLGLVFTISNYLLWKCTPENI